MTTLNLLKKWAEREPEWITYSLEGRFHFVRFPNRKDQFECDVVDGYEPNSEAFLDVLQGTLQRAIASRPEWGFNLYLARRVISGAPAYFAVVDTGNGIEHESGEHDEPAVALLQAYLSALEAVQTEALTIGRGSL